MTLLQSSSSGSILFDDCDILHHRKEIRSVLGYLPQDFRFFEKLKTWEFLDWTWNWFNPWCSSLSSFTYSKSQTVGK